MEIILKYNEPFIIEPKTFEDERGYFSVLFVESDTDFHAVQDNQSYNKVKNVFRGMHWQEPPYDQAKLVRCVEGKIVDYVIDIRKYSPTFGKMYAFDLDGSEKPKWVFIPRGFAHGYLSVSDTSKVEYKVDNFYNKESERGMFITEDVLKDIYGRVNEDVTDLVLSQKDLSWPTINEIETNFVYNDIDEQ